VDEGLRSDGPRTALRELLVLFDGALNVAKHLLAVNGGFELFLGARRLRRGGGHTDRHQIRRQKYCHQD
jgi:hypothetical protein